MGIVLMCVPCRAKPAEYRISKDPNKLGSSCKNGLIKLSQQVSAKKRDAGKGGDGEKGTLKRKREIEREARSVGLMARDDVRLRYVRIDGWPGRNHGQPVSFLYGEHLLLLLFVAPAVLGKGFAAAIQARGQVLDPVQNKSKPSCEENKAGLTKPSNEDGIEGQTPLLGRVWDSPRTQQPQGCRLRNPKP